LVYEKSGLGNKTDGFFVAGNLIHVRIAAIAGIFLCKTGVQSKTLSPKATEFHRKNLNLRGVYEHELSSA
jgi:hypothetical protein